MRKTIFFVLVGEIAGAISLVLAAVGSFYALGAIFALDPTRQTELMKLDWWEIAAPLFVFSVVAIVAEDVGDRLYRRNPRIRP